MERAEAPRSPGIVGEIIGQFADRFAFLRELVQNAIDAGTASVEVRLEHDAGSGLMKVSVRDQGEGMTREIVEGQLLVLFRSTKEKDDSKIGKFGIGFASVLAPRPSVVVVQTARAGQRLTLHLHPDLTYQLFEAGPATKTGTSVSLELAMGQTEADGFAKRCREALEKWCRHALVPIHFVAEVPEAGLSLAERIDRPLGLEGALLEVRGECDGGKLVAVVGIGREGSEGEGAFFNQGLLLQRTERPLLGRIWFQIQDARLGHTLSREDVRRDEHYDRALAFARRLVEEQLTAKARAELERAAEEDSAARFHALAAAIEEAELPMREGDWRLRLVETLGGRRSLSLAAVSKRLWWSKERSAASRLLARANIPVAMFEHGLPVHARMTARIAERGVRELWEVEAQLTLVEAVAEEENDAALLGELAEIFAAVIRAPSALVLAKVSGALGVQPVVSGHRDDAVCAENGRYALDLATARRNPFKLLRTLPLILSAEHALVKAARRGDPRMGAAHLARIVLRHYGLLDAERSAVIFERTLAKLGVA